MSVGGTISSGQSDYDPRLVEVITQNQGNQVWQIRAIKRRGINNFVIYREFLPYANFITADFVTVVFQNYYNNFANAILWAIDFVSAFIS